MGEGFEMDSYEPIKEDKDEPNVDTLPGLGTDSEKKEEEEENNTVAEENTSDEISSPKAYMCNDCKTTFLASEADLASYCIYCGGRNISTTSETSYEDYKVVPFAINMDEAFKVFRKKIGLNPLVPFSYRSPSVKNKMRKVLIPCTLYHIDADGEVTFLGADKIAKVQGVPMQTFESNYDAHFEYSQLLSSGYSKLGDDVISNINDYDFLKEVSFNTKSLRDIYCIYRDIDEKTGVENVKQKITKHSVGIVRSNVGHDLKKLKENRLSINFLSTRHFFIPAYMLNLNYKGKEYLILINGQTGKSVINVPISSGSIAAFSIVTFIAIFLLSILIAHFL